jgi:hypothetical protein
MMQFLRYGLSVFRSRPYILASSKSKLELVTIPESPDDLPIYAPLVDVRPSITTKVDGATARGDGTGLTDRAQA